MTDNLWEIKAEDDGGYAIACALIRVAKAIDRLGNGDAATNMGALEAFGLHIGEKMDGLTAAIADERTPGA